MSCSLPRKLKCEFHEEIPVTISMQMGYTAAFQYHLFPLLRSSGNADINFTL